MLLPAWCCSVLTCFCLVHTHTHSHTRTHTISHACALVVSGRARVCCVVFADWRYPTRVALYTSEKFWVPSQRAFSVEELREHTNTHTHARTRTRTHTRAHAHAHTHGHTPANAAFVQCADSCLLWCGGQVAWFEVGSACPTGSGMLCVSSPDSLAMFDSFNFYAPRSVNANIRRRRSRRCAANKRTFMC